MLGKLLSRHSGDFPARGDRGRRQFLGDLMHFVPRGGFDSFVSSGSRRDDEQLDRHLLDFVPRAPRGAATGPLDAEFEEDLSHFIGRSPQFMRTGEVNSGPLGEAPRQVVHGLGESALAGQREASVRTAVANVAQWVGATLGRVIGV